MDEELKEKVIEFAEKYIQGIDTMIKEGGRSLYCATFTDVYLGLKTKTCSVCPLSFIFNDGVSICGEIGTFLEKKRKMLEWLEKNKQQFEFEF